MESANAPNILLDLDVIDKVQVKLDGTVTRLLHTDSDSRAEEVKDINLIEEGDNEDKELKGLEKKRKKRRKHKESKLVKKGKRKEVEQNEKQHAKLAFEISKDKTTKQHSSDQNTDILQTKSNTIISPHTKDIPQPSLANIHTIQTSWCTSTGGVYLHPNLCSTLVRGKFLYPTLIQASTLAAAILGKRDIVGAAPTGSGKTLCYILPILQYLMELLDTDEQEVETKKVHEKLPLTALVLCPTRELALQVSSEFNILSSDNTKKRIIKCAAIVGGLAKQKQKRVLNVQRPPIIVGTPGRLWELISSNEHDHLRDLSKLRFLVIDEADRMISSRGSFPQLSRILDVIYKANPSQPTLKELESEMHVNSNDEDEDEQLKGMRGETRVTMLTNEVLKGIELRRNDKHAVNTTGITRNDENIIIPPKPMDMNDVEYNRMQQELLKEQKNESEELERIHRQTFIFSATLALPASWRWNLKEKKRHPQMLLTDTNDGGTIMEILNKAGACGHIKFVDLTNSLGATNKSVNGKVGNGMNMILKFNKKGTKRNDVKTLSNIELPPGLSLCEIKCTQKHKDSHLYAYLTTTKQGSSGPCLIFCNSILAVKRVYETLKALRLPVRGLHAHMQQKARFVALESIKKADQRAIVVATDVGARGLDIPSVATVIHYDVPRAIDTFVHRAGRTARGVGHKAIGMSLSLISVSEERTHVKICETLYGCGIRHFKEASIDGTLLFAAQQRVSLASKIVSCEAAESKTRKCNKWFVDAAAEAGIDVDEDWLDDGLVGGSCKDRQRLQESKRAKLELQQLLTKPMETQSFRKFFSGAGLINVIHAEKEEKCYVVPNFVKGNRTKKRRKAMS